jgi:hypothetical protein
LGLFGAAAAAVHPLVPLFFLAAAAVVCAPRDSSRHEIADERINENILTNKYPD